MGGKIEKKEIGRACGAFAGDERGVHKVMVGKPEERRPLGDTDVDGKMILRWMFRNWKKVVGTGWTWPRIGSVGGHL